MKHLSRLALVALLTSSTSLTAIAATVDQAATQPSIAQSTQSSAKSSTSTTDYSKTYTDDIKLDAFQALRRFTFTDVPTDYWAYKSITGVTSEGLMSGYKNNMFKPDSPLTREEAAALFSKLLGENSNVLLASSFKDITSDRWSAAAIESVARKNIISGYGDNTYRPEKYMSRQEFAVVADNYLHYQGYHTEDPTVLDEYHFSDQKFVASWAQDSVRELAYLGFLHYNPHNLFNPEKYITRAEAAEITYRMLYTKEANNFKTMIDHQQVEATARRLIAKTFGDNYDFRNQGAMFWRDDQLTITLKSEADYKALLAQRAYVTDKNSVKQITIRQGKYTLADFDNLQMEGAALYSQLDPKGTILDVKPNETGDALIFTVDDLDASIVKEFNRKFGKQLTIQLPEYSK